MRQSAVRLFFSFILGPLCLHAQDFKLAGREIQVHGYASQGFVHTDNNNWLAMETSHFGSGEFTEVGLNLSTQVTDKFRIGAQGFDRDLGKLGDWHPSLDWAFVDYRFSTWLGVRAGKVKTAIGLYNDTQDLDFLHTFALLPQSVYPTDIRDATMAHVGGDIYGNIGLKHRLGTMAYTAYAGHRSDSIHSGIAYLSSAFGEMNTHFAGLQYGADLRWNTPLKGLLVGTSRMNQDITDTGWSSNPLDPGAGLAPYSAVSRADWTNQFYGQYVAGKLQIDSEHRRFFHDQVVDQGAVETFTDVRGWYVAGSYRVIKKLTLGSYYSRYSITNVAGGPLAAQVPTETDTSLPANHIYDKVITARIDLKRFWNVKVEGHFMNGYGASTFPDGFYPQVNPQGFKADTNALVIKTGMYF